MLIKSRQRRKTKKTKTKKYNSNWEKKNYSKKKSFFFSGIAIHGFDCVSFFEKDERPVKGKKKKKSTL